MTLKPCFDFRSIYEEARQRFINDATGPLDISEHLARVAYEAGSRTLPLDGDIVERRLWLWKNFVDGKPEYWAFDNPFPTKSGDDPLTLGEPCGWAILKPSVDGRPGYPVERVEAAITATRSGDGELQRLRAENERLSKAVCGGILGELLTEDETEALVSFIKQLRDDAALSSSGDR